MYHCNRKRMIPGLLSLFVIVLCSLGLSEEAKTLQEDEEMQRLTRSANSLKMLQDILQPLDELVNSHGPKSPCSTRMRGPRLKKANIAIVGGGIAGLHMAYLLKQKGYLNVVVLEKSSWVGGKVWSVEYEGVVHEMGACYLTPDYEDNVYPLAAELGIGKDGFVPIPSSESRVWLDEMSQVGPMTFHQYLAWDIMQRTDAKNPTEAMNIMIKHAIKYIFTHLRLFGRYPGDIMPRPSNETLSKLNQTFMSFLSENDLMALHPLFIYSFTLQGYGYLDDVSALYGLMWNTPKLILSFIKGTLNNQFPIQMFKKGFQQLTDRLEKKLMVEKNVQILKIFRNNRRIKIKLRHNGKVQYRKYQFLIWAADSREALKVLTPVTDVEKKFAKMQPSWFATTLVRAYDHCLPNVTIQRWLSSLFRKEEYAFMAFRDSQGVLEGRVCPAAKAYLSGITYQYGTNSPINSTIVQDKFESHYDQLEIEDREVIRSKTWDYFPHFGVRDMADGIVWDIIEKQGTLNTWFIGGSVCHESVKSIINYNKMLVEGMQ